MKVRTTKIHKLCVYSFPHCIPNAIKNFFISTGELSKEEDVLEWLIENKSTGDDEEIIEDVTAKTLHTLIGNVDNLVVLFCKYILVFPTCHCIFFVPSMQKRKKIAKGQAKSHVILSVGLLMTDIHVVRTQKLSSPIVIDSDDEILNKKARWLNVDCWIHFIKAFVCLIVRVDFLI